MKKNNIAITCANMTANRTHSAMLDLLNSLNNKDMFERETITDEACTYWPLFNTTVKSVTVEPMGKNCGINIALESGVILYGTASHLERTANRFTDFAIYEVELPRL